MQPPGSPEAPVTQAPPHADQQPVVAGAANVRLSCDIKPGTTRAHPCDAPAHHMAIVGDKKSCYRRRDGTWKLEFTSTGAEQDQIMVIVDNFNGPGTYRLDEPYKRYAQFSDTVTTPSCVNQSLSGAPHTRGEVARSPGRDKSCTSSGCVLTITSPDPNAPDRYNVDLSCPELCEDNSITVCKASSGPVRLSVTADCPFG
jgi:hypothetical protein